MVKMIHETLSLSLFLETISAKNRLIVSWLKWNSVLCATIGTRYWERFSWTSVSTTALSTVKISPSFYSAIFTAQRCVKSLLFVEFLLFSSPYELLVAVFTLNVLILKCHLELTPFRMQISTNYIRILLQIYKYLWIRNEFGLIRHNSHVLFFLFILSA